MQKLVLNILQYILKKEGVVHPLFLLFFICNICFSQTTPSKIDQLFNFSSLEESNIKFKDKQEKIFFNNKVQFLLALFNEVEITEDFILEFEQSIKQFKNGDFSQPHLKHYYIGEAQLILSLLQMKQGRQFQSGKLFMKAHQSFSENLKKYPNFKDPEIPLSFMEISASILPKSLKWLTSWFGVHSDKDKAIANIKKLYQSNQISELAKKQCEALNLYLMLQLNTSVLPIHSKYKHQLTQILSSELLLKQKQFSKAANQLNSIEKPISVVYFLLGKAYFLTENCEAEYMLNTFIEKAKTPTNTSATYFYLYQLDVLENRNSTSNYNNTIKKNSKPNFRDKRVQKDILKLQSKHIIKSRILFDRGDYRDCISFILETKNPKTILDLYYLSNAYLELGEMDKAISYFELLEHKCDKAMYYTPKTALHLAQKTPNIQQAIQFLQIINNYNNYPYQNEIEARQELLLKKLKNKL